jgi:sec-independent protein translocase protein TatA
MSAVPFLFIGGLSTPEMMVVLLLGLLLFGSKLPDVGRQIGRSLMEFKKGMKGFTDDLHATERETERLIAESEEEERIRIATRKADEDRAAAAATPAKIEPPPDESAAPPTAT